MAAGCRRPGCERRLRPGRGCARRHDPASRAPVPRPGRVLQNKLGNEWTEQGHGAANRACNPRPPSSSRLESRSCAGPDRGAGRDRRGGGGRHVGRRDHAANHTGRSSQARPYTVHAAYGADRHRRSGAWRYRQHHLSRFRPVGLGLERRQPALRHPRRCVSRVLPEDLALRSLRDPPGDVQRVRACADQAVSRHRRACTRRAGKPQRPAAPPRRRQPGHARPFGRRRAPSTGRGRRRAAFAGRHPCRAGPRRTCRHCARKPDVGRHQG